VPLRLPEMSSPGAPPDFRVAGQSDSVSCGNGINPIEDLSFLLSWTTRCANGSSPPE